MTTAQHTQKGVKRIMVEETVKTKAELVEEMKVAAKAEDWKVISKISSSIAKMVKEEEKVEKDAKLEAIAGLTEKVKSIIDKTVQKLIDTGELDPADGIWYVQDFGEKLTSCRLLKTAPRKSGGGGAGKKLNITTTALLEQFGESVIESGDLEGMTFKAAYESNTNGNFRYKLRLKMAKLAGLI